MPVLAHKIELKPTPKQAEFLRQCAGSARFVYNWGLEEWNKQYEDGGKPSAYSLCKEFRHERNNIEWTKSIPSRVFDNAILNLGEAFADFFRRLKSGKRLGFPSFKRKGKCRNSFNPWGTCPIAVRDCCIRIPKLGLVKMTESLRFVGRIITGVVSEKAGRWFVSITVEIDQPPTKIRTGESQVGIDLGCKSQAVLSTGEKVVGPKPLAKLLPKLQRLSRRLDRCVRGSGRWEKARLLVARLHARIANVRLDAIHRMTTRIVLAHSEIAIEDLNVQGMGRLRSVARSVYDQSFSEIRRQLEYKSEMYGATVTIVDRWFPSSKTCSACGSVKKELKLSDRTYVCAVCGFTMDRDTNASINLLNQIGQGVPESTRVESVGISNLAESRSIHLNTHQYLMQYPDPTT